VQISEGIEDIYITMARYSKDISDSSPLRKLCNNIAR
jgi:hypothetical protein